MTDTAAADLHRQLKAIIETVLDGIITTDARGIVRSFNPAAERMFGYSAAEVLHRNLNMLMPEPHRSRHDGYIQRYLTTNQRRVIGSGREVEGLRKDGSRFPMELSLNEMIVGGDRMFTGVARDVSQRKQAEAQLSAADRLISLGTLTAGIAHELNTPEQFVSDSLHFLREAAGDTFTFLDTLIEIRRLARETGSAATTLDEALTASVEAEQTIAAGSADRGDRT